MTSSLDHRTRKMLRRAQQLEDEQQAALMDELEMTLVDMERIETYAYHMAEEVSDVMKQLR
jgi:hypothetical protein